MGDERTDRRRVLLVGATAGLLAVSCGAHARTPADPKDEKGEGKEGGEEDVSPPEDLMREHGVLRRILLIYDETSRRIQSDKANAHMDVLAQSAQIIRHFIEDYHEKLEEDELFPRFEKANKLVDLVATLRRQHEAGRAVTAEIQRLATNDTLANADATAKLVTAIGSFVRMYAPHAAREDTVLFPALHEIVPPKEMDELGERFEDKEHQLFGPRGFEGVVDQVAGLEKTLGIYDLAQFTPKA